MSNITKTIIVSGKLKVEVGVYYSKFVRLTHFQRTICLSDKLWRFVENNQELICKSLEENSEYGLQLTDGKAPKVGMYKNNPYLTFSEVFTAKDGQDYTKYLSIGKNEWHALQHQLASIRKILDYDVIYAELDSSSWNLLTPGESVVNVKKKLVPRLCNDTFMLQVCTYLMSEKIKASLKKSCFGCATSSTDDYAHTMVGAGCMSNWASAVDAKYAENKLSIPTVVAAIESINGVMQWDMRIQAMPSDNELRDVIIDEKIDTLHTVTCSAP